MNFYLSKYGFQPPFINTHPHPELGLIVVIPCYDEDELVSSLNALYTCEKPTVAVEVVVIINAGEKTPSSIKLKNQETYSEAIAWASTRNTDTFKFHFLLEENLPKKHAGVGLARKIGMDEAVNRFDQLEKDGIIVCFDADALCEPNYLQAIENHFNHHPKTPGCSIHYEHPIEGKQYSSEIYEGIINYELHLRYYNQGLRFANLPYAYHTVGSSMAVRSSAYQKQGGMNKRKAGEDFYFIHKIIALGGFTELKTTAVLPSPRISDRVPFGTGKAIGDWIAEDKEVFETYNFESFVLLKSISNSVKRFRTEDLSYFGLQTAQNDKIYRFLLHHKFYEALAEIRLNSKTEEAFIKRFFRWFDAFKVLKFMHYMRDEETLENQPVHQEVSKLFQALQVKQKFNSEQEQLLFLRELEKK